MFFDRSVTIRLREIEVKEAEAIAATDTEIQDLSHLIRIALIKYLKDHKEKQKEHESITPA